MASLYQDEDSSEYFDNNKLDYYDTYFENQLERSNFDRFSNPIYHGLHSLYYFKNIVNSLEDNQRQKKQQEPQEQQEQRKQDIHQNLSPSLILKPSSFQTTQDRFDYKQYSSQFPSLTLPKIPSSTVISVEKSSSDFLSNENNLSQKFGINNKNILNFLISPRKLRNIYQNSKSQTYRDNDSTIRYKSNTSINGFKNSTSTNFAKQLQHHFQQGKQRQIKRNLIEAIPFKDQLKSSVQHHQQHQFSIRNHQQTRSVVDSESDVFYQPTYEAISNQNSDSSIAYDRIDIPWIEITLPFNTILGVTLIGLLILGFVFTFWLKKLQNRRQKVNSECVDKKKTIFGKLKYFYDSKIFNSTDSTVNSLDSIIDKFKVMDHEYVVTNKEAQFEKSDNADRNTRESDNDTEVGDDLTEKPQPCPSIPVKQDRQVFVDTKLSPVTIGDQNFVFTSMTPISTVSTVDKQSLTLDNISPLSSSTSASINCNSKTISIPVPVPVPIAIPVLIPAPQHIFPQLAHNLETNLKQEQHKCSSFDQKQKFYENEKDSEIKSKIEHPSLIKSASLTSSGPALSSPDSVASGRRFSLYERRTLHHSQQQLHHQLLTRSANSELSDLSTAVPNSDISQQKHSIPTEMHLINTMEKLQMKCNSPKLFDYNTDDKENEIPAGDEGIYSPKMKLSEHVLAQQNSPRHFETPPSSASSITTTISRFSFSSKQNLHNETPTSSPNIISNPVHSSFGTNLGYSSVAGYSNTVNSSPLLSSAVYRHGDYFKFPEVDCLTPVDKNIGSKSSTSTTISSTTTAKSPLDQLPANEMDKSPPGENKNSDHQQLQFSVRGKFSNLVQPTNQATRRSRLKSISLDSDGARLVEDNLGIAVEELIEIANQSPKLSDECFVFDDATSNVDYFNSDKNNANNYRQYVYQEDCKNKLKQVNENLNAETFISKDYKYNPLNKNRLKIDIRNEPHTQTQCEMDDNASFNSNSNLVTPKTPTLTQTKQKAISLDSSDTIMQYMPTSHHLSESTGSQGQSLSNSATTSLLQISSISVPTTPKRQQLQKQQLQIMCSGRNKLTGKKSGKYIGAGTSQKSSISLSVPGKLLSTANAQVSSSSFDYHLCNPAQKQSPGQHFMRKLRSFNESINDCDDCDDHYFLDVVDGVVVVKEDGNSLSGSSAYDDVDSTCMQLSTSSSNLLGANLLNQRCSTSLSLSNNNLKTLPEVMTLNDFTNDDENSKLYIDDDKLKQTVTNQFSSSMTQITTQSPTSVGIESNTNIVAGGGGGGGGARTPRNSILQRRGSNHSLTLNLNSGSLGNLTKSLSVSNYSLGSVNFQNSQLNLSGSSYNLNNNQQFHHQPVILNTNMLGTNTLSASEIGVCMPNKHPSVSSITNFANSSTAHSKKNLLQRRGSNTSLTLNIKGTSCMSLNRFNSHSSLNISSQQQQQGYLYHQQGNGNQVTQGSSNQARKGLLERRNSNASLTLNIQNRALSISNCNLQGSACSLSSNPTEYVAESNIDPEHEHCDHEQQYGTHQYSINTHQGSSQHRKFLSSENLNVLSQRTKLNQTHYRNLTKTCFGSVSDLNPQQHYRQPSVIGQFEQQQIDSGNYIQQIYGDEHFTFDETMIDADRDRKLPFKQSNLCSCTGVRNITTRPLSPQSTSEDFKMYLANIQLLQNASNILTSEHLRKLNYMFEKSYSSSSKVVANAASEQRSFKEKTSKEASADSGKCAAVAVPAAEDHFYKDMINLAINFELPNDDEQKSLLRNLHQEFWDLPTNFQEKPLVLGSQTKNRYKSILPNEHSRVILDCESGNIQEPYINANYIKGPDYAQNSYIATQGPMPNTMYEYWLMINQNIRKFITSSLNGKFQEKSQSALVLDRRLIVQETNDGNFNFKKDEFEKDNINTGIDNRESSKNETKNNCKLAFSSKICSSNERSDNKKSNHQEQGQSKQTTNINQKIVMLTNFVEHNKQKCSIYFPVEADEVIMITNTNEKSNKGELIEFYKEYLKNTEIERSEMTMSERSKQGTRTTHNNDNATLNSNVTLTKITYRGKRLNDFVPKTNFFILKNVGIANKNGYTIRKLICLYCQRADINELRVAPLSEESTDEIVFDQIIEQFECYHYWYPDWPDHRSPNDIGVLLDMSLHILDEDCELEFRDTKIPSFIDQKLSNIESQPMPIIHCSAGIGRTGCLAAILNGLRQMRLSTLSLNDTTELSGSDIASVASKSTTTGEGDLNKQKFSADSKGFKEKIINVDVLAIVCNLRLQRGGMVQNSEQYELIHRTLCLYLKRLESSGGTGNVGDKNKQEKQ